MALEKEAVFRNLPRSIRERRQEEITERQKLEEAARVLAEGGLILWNLTPTPGLAVDGTNPRALEKLKKVKGIEDPSRPFVSTTRLEETKKLINVQAHHPLLRPHLENLQCLLHPQNLPIFYRFHANLDLKPPLVKAEGKTKTIVLLVHNDPIINSLVDQGKQQKRRGAGAITGEPVDFLITGSSANKTGAFLPRSLEEVDVGIRALVDFELIVKKPATLTVPSGPIPVVDLTAEKPYCLREGVLDIESLLQSF